MLFEIIYEILFKIYYYYFFFSKFNTYIEEKLITSPIKRSNLQRNFSYISSILSSHMIIPQHIPRIVQLSTRLNPVSRRSPKELPPTETKISFQPETILYILSRSYRGGIIYP